MRISSFTVYGHSNGSIIVNLGGNSHMTFDFTDEESNILRLAAQRIVEERQIALTRAVAQPLTALADFSEAADDMPF